MVSSASFVSLARVALLATQLLHACAPVAAQRCPSDPAGWLTYPGREKEGCLYKGNQRNWYNAYDRCIAVGGLLARFRDGSQEAADESLQNLKVIFDGNNGGNTREYWLNAYGEDTGWPVESGRNVQNWAYQSGVHGSQTRTTYRHFPNAWKELEPNNAQVEHCLEWNSDSLSQGFNDEECYDEHYFYCQRTAQCTTAEMVEADTFGCICNPDTSEILGGTCTLCASGNAWRFVG